MIKIDIEQNLVIVEENGVEQHYAFDTPEAFKVISDLWLRAGWDNKYVYSFTWLGRPIIQLPEDLIRIQEVIFSIRPDVIVETGVAHGGSVVFYASLCKAMNHGRVIGVDIEIRPPNRQAIESHELASLITLIEGSSIEPVIVDEVKAQIAPGEKVMVLLDSCHEKDHVLAELSAFSKIVSPGSYIVAMDGIMGKLVNAPRSQPDWFWNNPKQAAIEFVAGDSSFAIEEPSFVFNEGRIHERVTYWPSAFIRRLR